MLVMSLGLQKTGAITALGRWARRAPLGGPTPRLFAMCLVVALVSPFLNNTAVVVVFLPIFVSLARQAGTSASKYLIPLSYTAILGGTATLIGTSTNLIVFGMAESRGYGELSLFTVTPLGVAFVAVGFAYLFTVGRRLLPDREGSASETERLDIREFTSELEVPTGSDAEGRTLDDLKWPGLYGVTVLGVHRDGDTSWSPSAGLEVEAGDVLFVRGDRESLLRLAREEGLTPPDHEVEPLSGPDEARLVEVLVTPGCPLIDHTLKEIRFHQRFGATVVALQHHERTVRERLGDRLVKVGDLLLLHGRAVDIEGIVEQPGFTGLTEIDLPRGARPHPAVPVGILTAVVAAAGTGLTSIVTASLAGVVAMLFAGCVRTDEVYDDLDWMVVFLLAGLIPLGIAMEVSGAAGEIASVVAGPLAALGPHAAVAGFYLLTAAFTEVMSNNAAAAVLAPVAMGAAEQLALNPYALLVTVMFGASASFLTPIGYQTNALVYAPGGYRFRDFLRVGLPLHLLLVGVATFVIPLLWPS
jgi:di/tricarboxylate transporter